MTVARGEIAISLEPGPDCQGCKNWQLAPAIAQEAGNLVMAQVLLNFSDQRQQEQRVDATLTVTCHGRQYGGNPDDPQCDIQTRARVTITDSID